MITYKPSKKVDLPSVWPVIRIHQ